MYTSIRGIALRTIKHSDRNSILSLWTATHGRISVALPAGSGKNANRLRALTMPLSPVSAEIDLRPDRSIYTMRDLRPDFVISGISASPAKTVTALFLADFLELSLRDQQPDPLLWSYIIESVRLLDALPARQAANFHLMFLLRLTRFIGIEPDWGERGTIFDLSDGCFKNSMPLHSRYLDEAATEALRSLARISPRNLHRYNFTRSQRRDILQQILLYYSLHHRPVLSLPSLDIISQM